MKAEGTDGTPEQLLFGGLDCEQKVCYSLEQKFYQEQAANERCMSKKSQAAAEQGKETKKRTPTFLLELPLQVNESQAARLRAHLEAGRPGMATGSRHPPSTETRTRQSIFDAARAVRIFRVCLA